MLSDLWDPVFLKVSVDILFIEEWNIVVINSSATVAVGVIVDMLADVEVVVLMTPG